VVLTLVPLLVLAACGTPTAGVSATATATATTQAAATSTAAAQATATAQPVTLAVQFAQYGTVSANDVELVARVSVANHTAAPIHLANSACFVDNAHTTGGRADGRPATIGLRVDDASTQHAIWFSWGTLQCVGGVPAIDVQEVPAEGTFTATLTCDLSRGFVPPGATLRSGVPYAIRVHIFFWHQGTADQFNQALYHPGQPGVLWDRELAVEVPFMFH
jgi:hypothetical protein